MPRHAQPLISRSAAQLSHLACSVLCFPYWGHKNSLGDIPADIHVHTSTRPAADSWDTCCRTPRVHVYHVYQPFNHHLSAISPRSLPPRPEPLSNFSGGVTLPSLDPPA